MVHLVYPIVQKGVKSYQTIHNIKWFQCGQYYLFAYSMAGNFIYSLILHGNSIYLINLRALFYGSNLYVIGKENVLSLLSVIFVLCNRVQSSKITSYFELF